MASSLHHSICEVKGEVKLQASTTISRTIKHQPGNLCLSRMGDTFYIQCVYDSGIKPSKKYKLDRKQVTEAKLVARDGKLTVYLTDGCARFNLEKGIENEIETFISCLDDIKRTVLTKAAAKNGRRTADMSPIPRVDTLFGSKEATSTTALVLRDPGLQKSANRIPRKTNETKEQSKLMSQTPNKAPQEHLSQSSTKEALKLTAQHGNRQQTPDKTPRKNLSQNQSKEAMRLTAQQGNRQQTPNKTPRKNLSQNQSKEALRLTAQQGNRQQTPNKTPRENVSQNQAKEVPKLTAQQGNRQQTPDRTSLRNLPFHEAKDQYRSKSLGGNSQQTPNKTPTSIPKIFSHPCNQQKQKNAASERMNSQKAARAQDDLEKENINIFIGSPERKRSPEKQSDSQWSTFGTPRKKTPLKENETSPQLSQPTNVKVFYGNNNNSIRVKRNVKRPVRKSSLDISSSSPPSQTSRYSPFSTTPTAARNIQTLNKLSSGDQHNVKQSTLSSYFSDFQVTSQGFTNLGNTCYMNAILQSILGLVPFVQELDNNDLLNTVGRLSLYNCMYNLFRWKNDDGSSTRKKNALKSLKNSLDGSEMTKRFSGHLQNDAHEFMNICLDQMKEEVQKALGEESETIAAKVCPVVRNFEGSLRKYIQCKGCKDVVTKDELFNHLSLNIPHNQSRSPAKVSLIRLLGRFFQAEELERSCEKCKCSTAVQYLKIRTLPRVIILHLLRSEFDQYRGTQEKNSHRIQVDRFLEIGSFCSSDISGPPPFVPKKTSPTKSHFVADNETPFSDEDFVVTKPRRRLNMSAALDELSDKKPEKSTSTSKNSEKYPDWVYKQTKRPTLSYSDSSDDDDLKKAKLASLCETQPKLSEEDQIKLATFASLQEKQADSEEQINHTRATSLHSEKEQIERTNMRSPQEKSTHDSEGERIKKATTASLKDNITHSCKEQVKCKEIASHQENEASDDKGQIERARIESLEGNQTGSSEEQIKCTKTTSLQREPTHFRESEQIEHVKIKTLQGNQTDSSDEGHVKPTTIASHQETQRHNSENEHIEHAKIGDLSEEQIKHKGTTRFQGKQTDSSYEGQIKLQNVGEQADVSSDEEQIKLANTASLQGKRSHDSDTERLERAMMVSLQTKQKEDLNSDILSREDVSDVELMEIDRLEESALSSDSERVLPVGINIDSNTTNTTGSKPLENLHHTESADNRNKSSQDSTNGSRKRPSLDSDVSVIHNTQSTTKRDFKLNGGATKLDTPSKRRKVEKTQTEIVSSDGDEDIQLKKALEISKKEHDKSRSQQEAIERSQMEEAIRMSLEDGLKSATLKDMVVEEPTEENPEVEKMEAEQTPSDEFSYRLVSVVSHVGVNASAGHYISDVYDVETDQWTRYDDITAKKIKEYVARYDKVSDGYIYFYMHKSCISNLLNQKSNQNQ